MTLSIRWRLTLWNTLGLAVLLLAFAGLVYALLRHALYEQVDHTLEGALRQLEQDASLAVALDERLRHWIEEWKEHENLSAVAYDDQGTVRERTEDLPDGAIPPPPELSAGAHRLLDRTNPVLGRQRVFETLVRLPDRSVPLVLMAPLEDVDHALGELRMVLLMAVPVMLLLSGGLGYVLARKALAPMERLRHATEAITADQLHRRLPVGNARDELGRLTETVNAMIGRLEQSFSEVRRFTADASHELRTPLTAIRSEAEVALARPLGAAEYQQLLGSILEECDRLTRLTDQLLALAREDARAARPAHEPVDVAALVGDVADTMRTLAEVKGLRLRAAVKGTAEVPGDGSRLREVLFNLLDNAIKYTPEGGEVEVRCERQAGSAVVTIRDTGVGIAPEHLPRVFDRFYRVDMARSRAEGGTGLGLSIVRSIVAAHGGRIELTSTPGRGTTATVILPGLQGDS